MSDTARSLRPDDLGITLQALDAQLRMLPYVIAFFGVSAPMFAMVAALGADPMGLAACVANYAIAWASFAWVFSLYRRRPELREHVRLRMGVQTAGGVIWAITILFSALYAAGTGPTAEILLVLCVGATVGLIFFTAPLLPALLLSGPIAGAGPVLLLMSSPQTYWLGQVMLGSVALAMALGMIMNLHLRGHFALAIEREMLSEDRKAALERATRLAKSKSDIVSILSHEIRNGLSGVAHVLAGALGAGSRGTPSREQLNAALHAARDLVDVLDATLDSETAEAGRLTVTTRPIDPARIAHDIALLHRSAAAAKRLEIAADVDPELLPESGAAIGDSARVRQVLNNLVGNAVKYTVRGHVRVRVYRPADDVVRFEVADTGPGLSDEELERAFEPFGRVARTGAGVNGAGLGLSLSRRLAELMGGQVGATSVVGVGSRFWLDLPFDTTQSAPVSQVSEAPAQLSGSACLKVLIAEDDALNAAMMRAVLEQLGHRVLHAQDGRRALELLRISEVDLIMLDGRMPVMDGPETAVAVRAMAGANALVPIIAVIGGDAEEARAMQRAGATAVLRKPVSVAAVARAVADVVALKACAPHPDAAVA